MFQSGMKVHLDKSWDGEKYPQLTALEYTVRYTYMTSSYTWVVLEEVPDQIFQAGAFGHSSFQGPYFAVKTRKGGFVISDLAPLSHGHLQDNILDYNEVMNLNQVREYFAGCAVCGQAINAGEKTGYLHSEDLIILPVCPRCCRQNPQIHAVVPKPRTYHDIAIDWWDELRRYSHMIQEPGLHETIRKEIEAKCDVCTKADCHPYCSAGTCPCYLVEDYLAQYHKDLFENIKPLAEERLRQAYPDPNEQ